MSHVQTLKAFVQQRLTAAAEEIFELFERTIAEYEETLSRQGKLLDAVLEPHVRLHRADVQGPSLTKGEVTPQEQEWRPSLDNNDPSELPHIKEEHEEIWSSQEGVHLQGLKEADVIKFTPQPLPLKSEEDDEEEPQSSQLHHTEEMKTEEDVEDCGGPEPDKNFNTGSPLKPLTDDEVSHSSEPETGDSFNWKETSEARSGLTPLGNNEEPEGNTEITPVPSSECSPSFGNKKHLREHSGIQTGVKPFSCSVCGKKYISKASLANHMRLHSEGKSISCPFCKKTFPFKTNLLIHMRVHTGEKPFCCSVCGSKFTQNNHLKKHMRIHTGEKPFSCSVCGTRFTQQRTLRNHLRTHTGERPFSCSVCDKSFIGLIDLEKHNCAGESSGSKLS